MPLDTYANLQTAVLAALARPDDPLVAPAVPDMVRLFESEARRRLKGGGNEHAAFLPTVAGQSTIDLPEDCGEIRAADIMSASLGDIAPLQFLAPQSSSPLLNTSGRPQFYTVFGSSARAGRAVMRLVPVPDTVYTVGLDYLRDLPPLSDLNPSNWLLESSPDAYFFGVLVEAEMYVGHDERVTMWLQRRDLAFASIEKADIKARWSGPLQLRADGITTGGYRSGGSAGSSSGGGGGGGGGSGAAYLADLLDVDTSGVAPGMGLVYQGPAAASAAWIASALGSGGASMLNDLLDVTTAGVAAGNALAFDGTGWVPITRLFFDLQPVAARAPTAGPRLYGGLATGADDGEWVYVRGGDAPGGDAGAAYLLGGNATAGNGAGGWCFALAGDGSGTGSGGRGEVNAGDSGTTGGSYIDVLGVQAWTTSGGMYKVAAGQGSGSGANPGGDVWIRAGTSEGTGKHGSIVLRGPNIQYFHRNFNNVDYNASGTIGAEWLVGGFGIASTPAAGTIVQLTMPSGESLNAEFPTRQNHDHNLEANNAIEFAIVNLSTNWTASVEILVPSVAFVGDSHASTLIDGIADTSGLMTGHFVIGAGSGTGNKIVSKTATSITTSSALAGTASGVPFTATPYLTQGDMTIAAGQTAIFRCQKLAIAPDPTWRLVRWSGTQRYGLREDRTAGVRWAVSNFSTSSAALAALDVYNASSGLLSMIAYGTNFTSGSGATDYIRQDGAALIASGGLSGGLSIVASAGDLRFYPNTSTLGAVLTLSNSDSSAVFRDAVRWQPRAAVTLSTNNQFEVEMPNNTQAYLVYRGGDGVTRRSAVITLT